MILGDSIKNCFERTLWCFVILGFVVYIPCYAAPAQENQPQNSLLEVASPVRTQHEYGTEGDSEFNSSSSIQFDSTADAVGRLEVPQLRLPLNTGPGNYLEDRKRQTDVRIQKLEAQVNQILEAQAQSEDVDEEREAQTAIQYGLNCERGETVFVCLMKKVVLLRREVSGIVRDVAELGNQYGRVLVYLEDLTRENEGKGGSVGNEESLSGGEGSESQGQGIFSDFPEADATTELSNETTESPFVEDSYRQDPLCPPKFERVGNVCYYVVTDRVNGVTSAQAFCNEYGGYLARPRDSLTVHDLGNHLTRLHDQGSNKLSELWVDGQYRINDETWMWNDNQEIDSSIWGISDTPTTAHETDTCVLLKKELNYLAMPQDCDYRYFFVCEAEMRRNIPAM